jgi:hypothetical protein
MLRLGVGGLVARVLDKLVDVSVDVVVVPRRVVLSRGSGAAPLSLPAYGA